MELFRNIRLKIGNTILNNKTSGLKRKKYFSNLNEVKNIGIVWDASKTDDFACLSRFFQKMHESKTDVKIMGYYPGKNLPNQYTAIRFLSVIKKDELNFFYHPVTRETMAFINNHFDILIDLNFNKLLPLQYISSLSNARLKVGLFEKETVNTPFDLMMEVKHPVNIENYLDQVIHYLGMINSGSVQKAVNN
jgi:hypothetical protein